MILIMSITYNGKTFSEAGLYRKSFMSTTSTSQWVKKYCSRIDPRINHKIHDVLRIDSQPAVMCSRRYQGSTMWMNISESVIVSANRSAVVYFESRPNSPYPTSQVRIVHLLGSSEAEMKGTLIVCEVGCM